MKSQKLIDALDASKLTVTRQRLQVCRALGRASKHLTARELYRLICQHEDKPLSVSACNRILSQFEEHGLVQRSSLGGDQFRYEIKPEQHHDHLIDATSGAIAEFNDHRIRKKLDTIASKAGYELIDYKLNLFVSDRRQTRRR